MWGLEPPEAKLKLKAPGARAVSGGGPSAVGMGAESKSSAKAKMTLTVEQSLNPILAIFVAISKFIFFCNHYHRTTS